MFRNPIPDVAYRPAVKVNRWLGRTNQKIKFSGLNKSVSKCAGYLCVDLTDADTGLIQGFPGDIDSYSQTAESCLIGSCNLNDSRINRSQERFDKLGNFYEPAGYQIHPAFFDGFICHPAVKEGFQAKILGVEGLQRNGIPDTDQLDQFEIFQVLGIRVHQIPNHRARLGHSRAYKNTHAGLYLFNDLCRIDGP